MARGSRYFCGDLKRITEGLGWFICLVHVGFSGFRRAITVEEERASHNLGLAEGLKTLALAGLLEVVLIFVLAGL